MNEDNKHGERIAKVETRLDSYQETTNARLKILEEDKSLLYKMTVLIEQNSKVAESNSENIKEMSKTFSEVNTNLTNLNNSQKELKEDVELLAKKQDNFESDLKKEKEKGVFDVRGFFMTKFLPALFMGLLFYLLFMITGIKFG